MAANSITPTELHERIDEGDPVTIVDVRDAGSFEEWHIDGPNVDAVNVPPMQLRSLDADALPTGSDEGPVVAVCASGQTSQIATQQLRQSGVDARNLQYGMNGWANLYTARELDVDTDATVVQFSRPSSGCLAYLVVDGDEAVVVDPLLAFVDDYIQVADRYGASIVGAVDTHVHADHVSGVRAFATRTDATLYVPEAAEARGIDYAVEYETLADGDVLPVGDVTVDVVHTPGHTTGMTAYLVDDDVLLTGDGLFVESVARPDLEDPEAARDAASTLYDSLQTVLALPADTIVAPAHFSDAADPAPDGSYTASLGDLVDAMPALGMDREAFVDFIVADLPPNPSNHEEIIATNLGQQVTPDYVAFQLELGPNNCAASSGALTE